MRVAIFAVTSLAEARASGSGSRFVRLQQYVMALTQALKHVDAFMEINEEFQHIARRDVDSGADMQKKIEYLANSIAEEAEVNTIVGVTKMPWS